jgi:two-component system chemotaxis sensor kinase CheA
MMILYDIPEDYFNVVSGLGSAKPRFLLVVPVISGEACIAVLELAAFKKPDAITGRLLQKVADALGARLSKYVVAT